MQRQHLRTWVSEETKKESLCFSFIYNQRKHLTAENLTGTYKSVQQIRRSRNLRGTETVVTMKFRGLLLLFIIWLSFGPFHLLSTRLDIYHKIVTSFATLIVTSFATFIAHWKCWLENFLGNQYLVNCINNLFSVFLRFLFQLILFGSTESPFGRYNDPWPKILYEHQKNSKTEKSKDMGL